MDHDEVQEALKRVRVMQKNAQNDKALARVNDREDVMQATLRADGTIESVGYDGSVTIRPAGWRPRG